ncbi:hypothetical protein pb186bvf_009184 [Paramecium bursaria]
MADDNLDRYHELLLNGPEEHVSSNKIYGLKYCALVLTQTLIILTRQIIILIDNEIKVKDMDYQSLIAITIGFIVSCYSSFIGHKKLFIWSFIAFIICYLILFSTYIRKSAIFFFSLNNQEKY